METPRLYRVEKDRMQDLVELFTTAFLDDPLYVSLIPERNIREKALPLYFQCYLEMYFGHAHIYADGPDLRGAVIMLDQQEMQEEYSFRHTLKDAGYTLKLLSALLKVDPTGRTTWSFVKNRKFLTSKWATFVGQRHMHIDFLAVAPESQHQGLGRKLLDPVLAYADEQGCVTTLETHNPADVGMYRHFGFKVVEEIGSRQELCQYCLER